MPIGDNALKQGLFGDLGEDATAKDIIDGIQR